MSLSPPPSRERIPVDNRTSSAEMPRVWLKWFNEVRTLLLNTVAGIASWVDINFAGSNITDIQTRNHDDLQNLNTSTHTHLTLANASSLTGGVNTDLHKHDTLHLTYPDSLGIDSPSYLSSIQILINNMFSSGILDGCALTDNGDGTIGIATGTALIRSSASSSANIYQVLVSAQTPISLTDDSANYVYLDYNSGAPQFVVSTSPVAFNGMDKVIAYVVHRLGTVLNYIDATGINIDNSRKTINMFYNISRFEHTELGSVIGNPSALTISVTAGNFYFMLKELPHDAFDTSVAGTANENIFSLWYHVAGVWTEVIEQKSCGVLYYDDLTDLVALGNNKYGVTWFYIINDAPSKLHAVLGQEEYPNITSAVNASTPSSLPSIVSSIGSLIGYVIYEKGAASFSDILSAFTRTFSSGTAVTHNGLSSLQGGTIAEYYHLTATQHTDLTDAGDSILHYHATDRARSNHTGTQLASTVSDFDSAVTASTHAGLTNNPHSVTAAQAGAKVSGAVEGFSTGGSGQITQQAAIDALTAVSGATNEHVLTKDTATGNAIFKASTGVDLTNYVTLYPTVTSAASPDIFGASGATISIDNSTPVTTTDFTDCTSAQVGSVKRVIPAQAWTVTASANMTVDGATSGSFTVPANSELEVLATSTSTFRVTNKNYQIGTLQTWQDVTASRANATNYTNTTKKPIQVNIYGVFNGSGVATNYAILLTVGGVLVAANGIYTAIAGGNFYLPVSAIVQPGVVYRIDLTNISTFFWSEMR